MSDKLREAAEKLLMRNELRYKHQGYGRVTCTSCGAEGFHDYDAGTFRAEVCSPSCPWRRVEEALKLISK